MKEYKNEEEFLKDYDPNKFDRLSLTTDILIFSVSDGVQENYRKLNRKYFSVLLVKRDNYPFKDKWCLPGGFVKIDEDIEDAAKRILKEEANISDIYIEQLYTYGNPKRDPRTRVISTSYMALIDKNKLKYDISKNASWFNVIVLEDEKFIDVTLDNGNETIKYKIKKTLKEKTTDSVVLIVAQRISTILHAEQIIVLDDGKIVGKGTHEELLKTCDAYYQIAASQLSESELKEAMKEED